MASKYVSQANAQRMVSKILGLIGGRAPASHTHAPASIGAAASSHTHAAMGAATASAAGSAGFVPAPAAGAQGKYLRGDGTWAVPPDTNTTYSAATQGAAGLMSAADKKKLDGIAAGATANGLTWQKVYPVGAVYISYESTSPASLFGGTWVQLTGRFLRMAGDVKTGGTARHRHWQTVGKATGESMYVADFNQGVGYASRVRSSAHGARLDLVQGGFSAWTGEGGMGATANIRVDATSDPVVGVKDDESTSTAPSDLLPPYQDLYAWRRTE